MSRPAALQAGARPPAVQAAAAPTARSSSPARTAMPSRLGQRCWGKDAAPRVAWLQRRRWVACRPALVLLRCCPSSRPCVGASRGASAAVEGALLTSRSHPMPVSLRPVLDECPSRSSRQRMQGLRSACGSRTPCCWTADARQQRRPRCLSQARKPTRLPSRPCSAAARRPSRQGSQSPLPRRTP